MTTRLIIISGPANSGKMPLARKLMADDPSLCLVHRDDIRNIIGGEVNEATITLLMVDMAERLISKNHSVVVCAWNLLRSDMEYWMGVCVKFSIPLVWLDVRAPEVKELIPPMVEGEVEGEKKDE